MSGKCTSLLNSCSILTLQHLSELTELYDSSYFLSNLCVQISTLCQLSGMTSCSTRYEQFAFVVCIPKFYLKSSFYTWNRARSLHVLTVEHFVFLFSWQACAGLFTLGENMSLVFKHSLQVKFENNCSITDM